MQDKTELLRGRSCQHFDSRLQDDDQLVRETAAKSLGELQRHELLDALHSAARREKVAHVRKAIEAAVKIN